MYYKLRNSSPLANVLCNSGSVLFLANNQFKCSQLLRRAFVQLAGEELLALDLFQFCLGLGLSTRFQQ